MLGRGGQVASKREKGRGWEFTVKRAGLLEKPLILTFATEAEGDLFCKNLESLLDRGIVPTEYRPKTRVVSFGDLSGQYLRDAQVSTNDREILRSLSEIANTPLLAINVEWVDAQVQRMKRELHYRPATIRKKIGAMARCCDWGIRRKLLILPDAPFRTLPEGYAAYTETDAALAGGAKSDTERDRRLESGEELEIRKVLERGVLSRKQREFTIPNRQDIVALFEVLLETAMRLREAYTLTSDQIDFKRQTINLDKTKNGDKRQVPMSSIAVKVLRPYSKKDGYIFPWLEEQGGNLKLTTNYLSKMFAQVFADAGCPDLHTHDLRHEATSRLFERTDFKAEEIMKCTGHKSHRMVMRYLNLRGSNLAARLW
jgi:integrase